MIVADTNLWIAYYRNIQPMAGELQTKIINGEVMIPAIVAAEFLVKATRLQAEEFEAYAYKFGFVEINWEITKQAAIFRRGVLRKSKRVLLLDCLIAATAKVLGAELWTLDKRDFPFKEVKVIEVGGL